MLNDGKIKRVLLEHVRNALRRAKAGTTVWCPYDSTSQSKGVRGMVRLDGGVIEVTSYQSVRALNTIKATLQAEGYTVSNPSLVTSNPLTWVISIQVKK